MYQKTKAYRERIGPLRVPVIPERFNPGLTNLIIEEERKREREEQENRLPLYDQDVIYIPDKPWLEH